jgi:chromosome segregation ATPase
MLMNETMNPLDLTITQLKRATAIKERIEALNKELRGILGVPATTRAAPKKKRTMTAAMKKQLAAARKARWANLRRANPATQSVKPSARAKKKTMSPAARAKLSAKLKAYWAAKKKTGKK